MYHGDNKAIALQPNSGICETFVKLPQCRKPAETDARKQLWVYRGLVSVDGVHAEEELDFLCNGRGGEVVPYLQQLLVHGNRATLQCNHGTNACGRTYTKP